MGRVHTKNLLALMSEVEKIGSSKYLKSHINCRLETNFKEIDDILLLLLLLLSAST